MESLPRKISERNHDPLARLSLDQLCRLEARHRAFRETIRWDPRLATARRHIDRYITALQEEIARREAVAA